MSDIHQHFRRGAQELVRGQGYNEIHRNHGIQEADWSLLTQEEPWTPEQSRQIRSILASTIEVCMTIAGMPAVPLPGQYCAAAIATIVSPSNRMVACMKVPDTFDAIAASGLAETVDIRPMRSETMMALVMAYSGGFAGEPAMDRLPREVKEVMKKEGAK